MRNEGDGTIELGPGARIHPTVRVNVSESLVIGPDAKIAEGCVIEGRQIRIGHELYMGAGAKIGGGSRFERHSSLSVGDFLHMGEGSFINTARPVTIGSEVGMGMGTKVFTHGAYLSALDGFPVAFAPVTIGDRVWLPGAIVNPGVTIGSDVVVGVNSLVTHDLPSGCLAAGSPAKVIRENAYPQPLAGEALSQWWADFWNDSDLEQPAETQFFTDSKRIVGPVSEQTELLRDALRRYGIRFHSRPGRDGQYESWLA